MNGIKAVLIHAFIFHNRRNHMKLAGAKMPVFTETAIEAIATRSQGCHGSLIP
ncbi:hypothetical protein [Bacillus sp. MRMR6]|uniref:hypothetical protein n=1 Tax=Bacillus sp. MRMR6 TaxID=1928617 RepID=UPI0020C9542E|nr:hypothetical protein [Bacillus sp. MRMR6]